jgi:hypothetical protein
MGETEWAHYGTESGNPKCANCMVHSGYEASSVDYGFGSIRGLLAMAKATIFTRYEDNYAKALLNEPHRPVHSYNPLVTIKTADETQA